MPFFDASGLPETPPSEYVAWVDLMGTQARMSRSLSQTANFIFKLHAAAITATSPDLTLYPIMDGFYAATPTRATLIEFLRSVFLSMAEDFTKQDRQIYRCIIRGCIAFGPTIHGRQVEDKASRELAENKAYRNAILLGLPMVQAHTFEVKAPPFGLYIHESARSFSPPDEKAFHDLWWRWKNKETELIWSSLKKNLEDHFSWCADRSLAIGYDADRIAVHKTMADQYFQDLET